jgi:thiol-disulfide isomerase/thioredoxin
VRRIALLFPLIVACNNPAPTKPAIMTEPSATAAAATTTTAGTTSAKLRVAHASQDSDALSLIRTKRLESKSEDRVLVVYVGATWCPPCKKFKEEIASGRLDEKLAKVTLLEFDADGDAERLAAAGYTFKFIPYVALPGADGHPAETQEATGKGANAWTELLGKLEAWQR